MGFFSKLFGLKEPSADVPANTYLTETAIKQKNEDSNIKFKQTKELFIHSLEYYNSINCQCSYPRFQQLIGIDCTNTGNSFKCYDTDLLIDLSAEYFNIEKSELNDENKNEKWVCKKCCSTYEYGWSDFSIYVERQKLKLTKLNVAYVGKPVDKPVPLYLGLMGHSYPSNQEIKNVSFDEFSNYMNEK